MGCTPPCVIDVETLQTGATFVGKSKGKGAPPPRDTLDLGKAYLDSAWKYDSPTQRRIPTDLFQLVAISHGRVAQMGRRRKRLRSRDAQRFNPLRILAFLRAGGPVSQKISSSSSLA